MKTNRIIQGDALTELRKMPDESIDMCMTSPPYWALRAYKSEPQVWDGKVDCQHEWSEKIPPRGAKSGKHGPGSIIGAKKGQDGARRGEGTDFCSKCGAWRGELGLEPTFDLYIKHLCDIFDEVKRVLKKMGTCWVNLGDTYWSAKGSCFNPGGGEKSIETSKKEKGTYPLSRGNKSDIPYLESKSLCQIPARFSIEMCNRGWILRNDIIWFKPNCMPSSVDDRFTVDYEHLFFFVKSKRYYFEQQFEPYLEPLNRWGGDTLKRETSKTQEYKDMQKIGNSSALRVGRPMRPDEQGRNKRCVWKMPTAPYPEAHFATYPEKLCEIPIKAGCPKCICKKCGKAKEKIIDVEYTGQSMSETEKYSQKEKRYGTNPTYGWGQAKRTDLGYTDCGCNAGWEGGIVLDPFCGSGTTCAVAKELGKQYIGIELKPEYIKLAEKRIRRSV